MDVRHNHRDLTPAQKTSFVQAVLALKNDVDSVLHPGQQRRYDDFVEVHKNAMTGPAMFEPMPHGSSLFYPWHRILLRQFELALQSAANDPSITLPYWDWDYSGAGNPFTPDFLGGDGDASQNDRVTIGPFAFAGGKFPIRVWDDTPGDPGLRRVFGEDATSWLPTASDVSAGLGKAPYWPGHSCFETVSEGVLHNPVHRWVGGNMEDASSPNDPVFFLHHTYLDLLWERWKQQHPTDEPYVPTSGTPARDLTSTLVYHAAGQPAPWQGSWTIAQVMKPSDLDYNYA
jgi:tyrosinase